MFRLIATDTFAKEMRKLENTVQKRIEEKLLLSAENPRLYFEGLTGAPLFKLRVGAYRIIAKISFPEKQIALLSVKHRKNAYAKP
ncbi:MAG TPA: type II toxin-antitoxin system RelE/ParE family toxin [archaeon]|nr:type II toxin-antitoxin system RelE/ParE family toxin [archaeon]